MEKFNHSIKLNIINHFLKRGPPTYERFCSRQQSNKLVSKTSLFNRLLCSYAEYFNRLPAAFQASSHKVKTQSSSANPTSPLLHGTLASTHLKDISVISASIQTYCKSKISRKNLFFAPLLSGSSSLHNSASSPSKLYGSSVPSQSPSFSFHRSGRRFFR